MKILSSFNKSGGSIIKDIKVLGIDLAKNVFQIHGADSKGNCKLRKRLGRQELIEFMRNCTPCVVGIEASGGWCPSNK